MKPEIQLVHGMKVLNKRLTMRTMRITDTMFKDHTYREAL